MEPDYYIFAKTLVIVCSDCGNINSLESKEKPDVLIKSQLFFDFLCESDILDDDEDEFYLYDSSYRIYEVYSNGSTKQIKYGKLTFKRCVSYKVIAI